MEKILKNVFFYPYVGKKYENGFKGVKLLILGESHYCGDGCEICGKKSGKDCPDFTTVVLDRYLNYKQGNGPHEGWMNTFTRFTNILFGKRIDNKTLVNFWDYVMFYNYVQSSTKGPRISPSKQQFEESEDAFTEVLRKYIPDLILVWGYRLWYNLPDIGYSGSVNILNNGEVEFYYYKVGNKDIPAYKVPHPSCPYFDYGYSEHLRKIISFIGKMK